MYKPQDTDVGDCLGKILLLILSISISTANQAPILSSSPTWLTNFQPI